jgi:hypothetical protein
LEWRNQPAFYTSTLAQYFLSSLEPDSQFGRFNREPRTT